MHEPTTSREGEGPAGAGEVRYAVVVEKCLRCGACASLAPGLIAMNDSAAFMVRQPVSSEELRMTEAALFNCPVLAIRKRTQR